MAKSVKLSEKAWDRVLQSLHHRVLQTDNPSLKAELEDLEKRIDAQLRD